MSRGRFMSSLHLWYYGAPYLGRETSLCPPLQPLILWSTLLEVKRSVVYVLPAPMISWSSTCCKVKRPVYVLLCSLWYYKAPYLRSRGQFMSSPANLTLWSSLPKVKMPVYVLPCSLLYYRAPYLRSRGRFMSSPAASYIIGLLTWGQEVGLCPPLWPLMNIR
jgi:hypothetical protein